MANRVLKVIFLQLFVYMISGCHLNAQDSKLVYNYNKSIDQIASDLEAKEIPECNTNLLSISNILMNYFAKEDVPERLLNFLEKNIINRAENKESVKQEVFLVARYIYSNRYNSYLLMVTEENNEDLVEIKDLYLLNIKANSILSLFHVASYYKSVDGYHFQNYSIYQGNGRFQNIFESITSDVEVVPEDEKVKQKLIATIVKINMVNGKAEVIIR